MMASGLASRDSLTRLKADLEIYLGFYLIYAWFASRAHLPALIFYWQLLRIKYMLGVATHQAFRRLKDKMVSVTRSENCPQAIKAGQENVQRFFSYMGDLDEQRNQHPIVRYCSVF